MNNMNVNGMMFVIYVVFNKCMLECKVGIIFNVILIMVLEVLFFFGEVVYYVNKVC